MIRLKRRPLMVDVKVGTIKVLDQDCELFKKYCEYLGLSDSPGAAKSWDLAELFYAAVKKVIEEDQTFQRWLKTGEIIEKASARRKKPAARSES